MTVQRSVNTYGKNQSIYQVLNAKGGMLASFSYSQSEGVSVLYSASAGRRDGGQLQPRVNCLCNTDVTPIQGTPIEIIKVTGTGPNGGKVLVSVAVRNINTGKVTVIYTKSK